MRSLDIGLSALRANQQGLAVHGNNIANASTPGYHRQRMEQAARAPNLGDPLRIGRGVDVTQITRLRSSAIENALIRNASLLSQSEGLLEMAVQLENIFAPNDGAIHDSLSDFFSAAEMVANAPQDLTVRREFLSSADRLMDNIREISQNLNDLRNDARQELRSQVSQVNGLLDELNEINQRIQDAGTYRPPANNLLDRRDQIRQELAELIDVSVRGFSDGSEVAYLAGEIPLDGSYPDFSLQLEFTADDQVAIHVMPSDRELPVSGGRIEAMLTAFNELIPDALNDLEAFASDLVRAVDHQHAIGLPDGGAFQQLLGARGVEDVNQPLALVSDLLPVEAGSIYITVTDLTTGLRRTEEIAFDPATDSLSDLAARIDALSDISANVDLSRNTLRIQSSDTHRFDFSGRPDNQPDLTAWTGSSIPEFSGFYSGDQTDAWTISFNGPGTIGVTDGLTATIRNSDGDIVAELDVGQGYEAGTPLLIDDGVQLQFSSGDAAATDTASIAVVADPDETGVLAALGLNSLFQGNSPLSFQVRPEYLDAPELLSISRSSIPGDAFNMARLSELRDDRRGAIDELTFAEYLADLTANTGLMVQAAGNETSQLSLFQEKLQSDRDSISGVDVNEEVLAMMQLERSFQAAARFVSVIDQTLQEILAIGR